MRMRAVVGSVFAAGLALAMFTGCDEGPVNSTAPTSEASRDPYAPVPMGGVPASRPRGGGTGASTAGTNAAAVEARLAALESKLDEALKLLYDNVIAGDRRTQALEARLDALARKSATDPATPVAQPAADIAVVPPPKRDAPAWTEDQKKWIGKYEAKFSGDAKLTEGSQPGDLIGAKLPQTRFLSSAGGVLDLSDYTKNKQKVVVVMLRGFAGSICLYCSAQTLALSRSEAEFKKRNAQVVLIYPGKADTVPMFIDAVSKLDPATPLPFPVGMDVDLSAVHQFRIRGELAKPSSFIIDETGIVRYAYTGANPTDRPGVKELLAELDKLK